MPNGKDTDVMRRGILYILDDRCEQSRQLHFRLQATPEKGKPEVKAAHDRAKEKIRETIGVMCERMLISASPTRRPIADTLEPIQIPLIGNVAK